MGRLRMAHSIIDGAGESVMAFALAVHEARGVELPGGHAALGSQIAVRQLAAWLNSERPMGHGRSVRHPGCN
eukprot:8404472-Alexandrium_andersonii.AAC.2